MSAEHARETLRVEVLRVCGARRGGVGGTALLDDVVRACALHVRAAVVSGTAGEVSRCRRIALLAVVLRARGAHT